MKTSSLLPLFMILSLNLTTLDGGEAVHTVYNHKGFRKSVSIPAPTEKKFTLDGRLDDPAWAQAALFDDFTLFKSDKTPSAKTEVRVWRDRSNLYLGVSCLDDEAGKIESANSENGFSVWQGDMIELFFGAASPTPWCMQLAIGAGGGRFSDNGTYETWQAKTSLDENGWYAEVVLPLSMLRSSDMSLGFNLCRQRKNHQEYSVWSPVQKQFHEVENFGELLLGSYDTAFGLRFHEFPDAPLSRAAFEELAAKKSVMAHQLLYGPFLSLPQTDSMTVSWITRGKCAAGVEYRKQGESLWHEVPAALENGLMRSDRDTHHVTLTELTPDTLYEYRLFTLEPVGHRRFYQQQEQFRTLADSAREFQFAVVTDIHGDAASLRRLLTQSGALSSDFLVNGGDMLSAVNGRDAFFDGFINVESELFAKQKPLVFVRGNHEGRGMFAGEYFDIIPHPSGKSYYTFSHGNVFFIVLDPGDDSPDDADGIHRSGDFLAEQRRFLEATVQSKEFRQAKHRIILSHFPILNSTYHASRVMIELLKGLFDAPENRIDFLVGGHHHSYFRIMAGSDTIFALDPKIQAMSSTPSPFTIVANDGYGNGGVQHSILIFTVSENKIGVKVVDADGRILDQF